MTPRERRYVGAISGTSVDGLDLAVIAIRRAQIEFCAGHTAPFPDSLRNALKRFAAAQYVALDELGAVDRELGEFTGRAILDFLHRSGISRETITAIGSHGQTIRHRPDGQWPFTMQIGDPHAIAEITAIDTYADFRRRDVAAGGQGAPLVPPFHAALFGARAKASIVLNIGGIANVTYLPIQRRRGDVIGFDTGPGNALIDLWAARHLAADYDHDGRWAASGKVVPALLERFLSEPYFASPPPKSTGKELFGGEWLDGILEAFPRLAAADVQATLVELTARSVAHAVARFTVGCTRVIVCGGGRLNGHLMARLAAAFEATSITTTDALGYNGDWIEAAAFAWLAHRAAVGRPGNLPTVTGARGERMLGGLFPGR